MRPWTHGGMASNGIVMSDSHSMGAIISRASILTWTWFFVTVAANRQDGRESDGC